MRIIEPSVKIITPIDGQAILSHIEQVGRVCYKSEDKITEESAEKFVAGIIRRGHEAVIEHFYKGDGDVWHFPAYCLVGKDIVDGRKGTLIRKNDRICQFRIMEKQPDFRFVTVDKLGNEDRGGIGSTGVR